MDVQVSDSMFNKKKDLLLLTGIVVLIVVITSVQDYFAASWNNLYFDFYESMAYKLFWLLFIPFYIFIQKGAILLATQAFFKKQKTLRLLLWVGLPVVLGLTHLFLFAYLLHVGSLLFHEAYWSLGVLIQEKLTTRLYIVLTVYPLLTYGQFRLLHRAQKGKKSYHQQLVVKNGSTTTLVRTADIKWIKADKGYLELQTWDKKHVIVNSLKNILENLDPNQFKRIHKSTIVNLLMIKSFKSRNNGDYDLILNDGSSVRLSRNYVKPIKELMF